MGSGRCVSGRCGASTRHREVARHAGSPCACVTQVRRPQHAASAVQCSRKGALAGATRVRARGHAQIVRIESAPNVPNHTPLFTPLGARLRPWERKNAGTGRRRWWRRPVWRRGRWRRRQEAPQPGRRARRRRWRPGRRGRWPAGRVPGRRPRRPRRARLPGWKRLVCCYWLRGVRPAAAQGARCTPCAPLDTTAARRARPPARRRRAWCGSVLAPPTARQPCGAACCRSPTSARRALSHLLPSLSPNEPCVLSRVRVGGGGGHGGGGGGGEDTHLFPCRFYLSGACSRGAQCQ